MKMERNYLSTNNSTENKLSSKFLDDAFKYEIDAFKALKSSGMFGKSKWNSTASSILTKDMPTNQETSKVPIQKS